MAYFKDRYVFANYIFKAFKVLVEQAMLFSGPARSRNQLGTAERGQGLRAQDFGLRYLNAIGRTFRIPAVKTLKGTASFQGSLTLGKWELQTTEP